MGISKYEAQIDKKNLDGWALPREALYWIFNTIPIGSTILELGSGTGTKELVKFYEVYSLEDNERWLGLEPKANYIYAPIVPFENMQPHTSGWYDPSSLHKLPKHYDLLTVDGPVGNNRVNFIHFLKYFDDKVPMLFDDTQREGDRNQAIKIAKLLDKPYKEIFGWEKNFIIVG